MGFSSSIYITMKKIFLSVIFYLTAITVSAQNEISGLITDHQGTPLSGVNIYVLEQNRGTVSNPQGRYYLKNIPKGKFKIQYSYVGFNNRLVTVIMDNSPFQIDITLEHEPIETQAVVVVGGYNSTQHENAVRIDVLRSQAISGSGTPNFTEILTSIPGIDMISKGNGISKPVIRGLSMNDILILNNGVRFENYQYSSHHPMGIDEFGIESVEVIKGPASLLYGSDAIGGVLDFVKEKPAPVGNIVGDYNLQLFSNSLGATTNLGVKGASQNFFWGLRGGGKSNADYEQGGGDFVPNSRFSEWSVKGNAGYAGKRGTFKLYYDVNEQKIGIVEPDVIPLITKRGRDAEIWYQTFNNQLLSSQNKLYLGDYKVEINAAYQNTNLLHYDQRTDPFIDMSLATLTYEAKLYFPSAENAEYIAGIQGLNQQNRNLNDRETRLLPDASVSSYSGFGLFQFTFAEKLRVQTGVRYDYRTMSIHPLGLSADSGNPSALSKNYNSVSGSLGATFNLSEKLLFRANVAAAFRAPHLSELTSNGLHENRYEVGSPELVPQHAFESDLSVHYHSGHLSFDVAGFYNRINDYIFISPTGNVSGDGFPIYKYLQSDARLFGGEAVLHLHPAPFEWLHFETVISSVSGKQDNDDFLPFIPAKKVKFELRAEKKRMMNFENGYLKINLQMALNQNNPAPDEEATAGYSIVDFGIGANFKTGNQLIIIGLTVSNVFDKKYIDHLSTLKEAGYFNPGRNIALNLKIPFGIR